MADRTDETIFIRLSESKVPITFAENELLGKYGFARKKGSEEYQITELLNEIIRERRRRNFPLMGSLVLRAALEIRERLADSPAMLDWVSAVRLLRKIPVRRCLQRYGLEKNAQNNDPLMLDRSVVIGCYSLPALLHRDLGALFVRGCPSDSPVCSHLSRGQREDLKLLVTRGFDTFVVSPESPVLHADTEGYEVTLRDRKQFPISESRAPADAFNSFLMTVIFARKAYVNREFAWGSELHEALRKSVDESRMELAGWVKAIRGQ
ncbi:MAG: hypothetical protein CVV64_07705 [Candidatus Wallbacteria bacterium HGW-Wallbacteria-1]|uniref:Uncharacterized protein n=1 Tax=Candidatus Wallbacteria bacterium HGW-Wallbacteria-1 TaxID=2013854 RepID=A0A2N1PQY2_9BACT|nr:MAG: hypothetical protein CVV64_07705 [Candidatus Wallbacteria bacterium HGW-Wallbacteria-1]